LKRDKNIALANEKALTIHYYDIGGSMHHRIA